MKIFDGSRGWGIDWIRDAESVDSIKECDAILIHGGGDLDSSLYGHPQHPRTWPSQSRDEQDWRMFKEAMKYGKSVLGICRGLNCSPL